MQFYQLTPLLYQLLKSVWICKTNHDSVVFTFSIPSLLWSKLVKNHFDPFIFAFRLLEVIKCEETSQENFEKMVAWGATMKKTTVRCIDTPGFIVNRLLIPRFTWAISRQEKSCNCIYCKNSLRSNILYIPDRPILITRWSWPTWKAWRPWLCSPWKAGRSWRAWWICWRRWMPTEAFSAASAQSPQSSTLLGEYLSHSIYLFLRISDLFILMSANLL